MSDLEITGSNPDGVTLSSDVTTATIESTARVSGDIAVVSQYGAAIQNNGTVTGGTYGVSLSGGSLTNAQNADISGSFSHAVYGRAGAGPVTVTNAGTISGGNGVTLEGGGPLTNTATGSIYGTNTGAYTNGIVTNAGTIGGADSVVLGNASSLMNAAGGMITGSEFGVDTNIAGNVTVENAGTISGDVDSINFNDNGVHTLIVDAGAVFIGDVVANTAGTNTLELSATGGPGTLDKLGSNYQGFQTVTIDSGATWTIGGTVAGFHGTTIHGFGAHDTLDLTDFGYSSDDTVSINGSGLLTVQDSAGDLATIQLSGDYSHDFFHLGEDANGGTYVTEEDGPACYCRGTLIRTDHGDVAVEDLKIGDQLITASGIAMPLKWIGRRSYRGWIVRDAKNQPILFKAGSIDNNIPARDLLVSPEHAMFLDGLLISARHLVNGVSIMPRKGMDQIDYFHLELEKHAVILAEGALSESFVDDNSRRMFHNAAEFRRLYPGAPSPRFAQYCAPRVDDGAELESVRRRLSDRARTVAIQPTRLAA